MTIYAISDLHLSLGVNKPMDIFGEKWHGHVETLEKNWRNTVHEGDFVIMPGDISWATYLEQALEDFKFIDSLPGKKIILKGNHDYWWTTMSKLEKFLNTNEISSISFLHNNSIICENTVICGTRGWKSPYDADFYELDKKIYSRELQRLELSLKTENVLSKDEYDIIVAMHYPPFNPNNEPSEFIELMKKYQVQQCIYGHIHDSGNKNVINGEFEGIIFKLVSIDYLGFTPLEIRI